MKPIQNQQSFSYFSPCQESNCRNCYPLLSSNIFKYPSFTYPLLNHIEVENNAFRYQSEFNNSIEKEGSQNQETQQNNQKKALPQKEMETPRIFEDPYSQQDVFTIQSPQYGTAPQNSIDSTQIHSFNSSGPSFYLESEQQENQTDSWDEEYSITHDNHCLCFQYNPLDCSCIAQQIYNEGSLPIYFGNHFHSSSQQESQKLSSTEGYDEYQKQPEQALTQYEIFNTSSEVNSFDSNLDQSCLSIYRQIPVYQEKNSIEMKENKVEYQQTQHQCRKEEEITPKEKVEDEQTQSMKSNSQVEEDNITIKISEKIKDKKDRKRQKKTQIYTSTEGKQKTYSSITRSMIRPVCNALKKYLIEQGANIYKMDWIKNVRDFLLTNKEFIPHAINFFEKNFKEYVMNSSKLIDKSEYLYFKKDWIKGVSNPENFKKLKCSKQKVIKNK